MTGGVTAAVVELLTPIVTAIAAAIGLWAASKLPGPVRTALEANVHARDVAALVGAMQRRAMAEVANHETPPPTAAEIVEYMRRIKPDLLDKLGSAPEALETMAASALATAQVATASPVAVLPVAAADDVLVGGGNLHRS
jgi:hypothetical protein